MASRREYGELTLLASACVVVLLAQIVAFRGMVVDDAYITFRYAENLASGAGLVFNPGDRVLGTTAPGHALLASALYRIVGHDALPAAMAIAGCVGWTAQAALVYALARESLGRGVAAFVALGVAVGGAHSAQFLPLETNLVAACGVAALVLADRRRPLASGAALGVAILLRPDAILLALPLALLLAARRARRAVVAGLASLLPIAIWCAFATAYYGSPVPRTLGAKAFHEPFMSYAAHVARELPTETLPFVPPAPVAALAWLVALWGARVAVRRKAHGVTALLAWGALHALAYLALRPGTGFPWHLYPSALALAVALTVAVGDALSRLPRPVAVTLGAIVVLGTSTDAILFARSYGHAFWYGSRDGVYRQAAAWLVANANAGDTVEAEEVGTMAYWSGLRFDDHAGLIGPPFDHGRLARGEAPEVRFSVMTQRAEVRAHLPFFGRVPPMKELAYDRWHLWIADLKAPRE